MLEDRRDGAVLIQRLRWIDGSLTWEGAFNRSDLMDRFSIKATQASATIRDYEDLNGGSIVHDRRSQVLRASESYQPAYDIPLSGWLGMRERNDDEPSQIIDRVEALSIGIPPGSGKPLLQGIRFQNCVRSAIYIPGSRVPRSTSFCPHRFFQVVGRWHVRGWDTTLGNFIDHPVAHFLDLDADPDAEWISGTSDIAWRRMARISFVLADELEDGEQTALSQEYGMSGGRRLLTVREPIVRHVLAAYGIAYDPGLGRLRQDGHVRVENEIEITAILRG